MAVTRDDIIFIYRAILGRDPTGEADYQAWLGAEDLRALVHGVGYSPEALARKSVKLPFFFKYSDSSDVQKTIMPILARLAPHKVANFSKIRVGRDNDGGYSMIDDFNEIKVAYSFGINDDVSWDLEMARRGIEIFQYDHTIDGLPVHHDLFRWEKKGIEGRETTASYLETVENLVKQNQHLDESNMILKCDIEGHEWEMLAELPLNIMKLFRQIVIEMHFLQDLDNTEFAQLAHRAVERLTTHHKVVHVHGNNCGAYSIVGGIALPSVIELTLLREDENEFSVSDETFPGAADMPCDPSKADFMLGSFRF